MFRIPIIFLHFGTVFCLSCDDVVERGNKKLNLDELQTLKLNEISKCISHLGKNNLTIIEANFIWNSLVEFYTTVEFIPEEVLASLHYITIAIKPEEYYNITFNSIDVVSNFGLDYGLPDAQLAAIAERVREDFGSKRPEDYTCYDLTALGQILCAFNKSEICRIHPKAYKETAALIGRLKDCNYEVMVGFAFLAVQHDAFGTPASWSKATVRTVGKVTSYLSSEDIL